jgi:hypothetical protein
MPKYRIFVFLLLLSGCSLFYSKPEVKVIKPPYDPIPNALDEEYFRSQSGDLIGHYPKDWLEANIENIEALEGLTQVYTDAARENAFIVAEIPGSADLRRRVDHDGLIAIAEESIQMRSRRKVTFTVTKQPEVFTEKNLHYASYEYETQDKENKSALKHRIVCVSTGVRFYELGILQLRSGTDKMAYLENFRLLQSVIAGLEGTAPVKATGE